MFVLSGQESRGRSNPVRCCIKRRSSDAGSQERGAKARDAPRISQEGIALAEIAISKRITMEIVAAFAVGVMVAGFAAAFSWLAVRTVLLGLSRSFSSLQHADGGTLSLDYDG